MPRYNPKTLTPTECRIIWHEANSESHAAAQAYSPTPMGVVDSRTGQSWRVDSGVCGFAWINIKPGNGKFANWLKRNKFADSDSYYGGVTIWVSDYGQSMERKEVYARTFAKILRERFGFERVYSMSRMD